ncbi:prephenate dehydrogenase/arogenate dehydrogenase family protein [Candidatus Sumerlaeota bacterium]|nr:prephenate dehydrogenase/arogenate dehydrogenase family protein [Candidatus Sumerlaeota bacterium]
MKRSKKRPAPPPPTPEIEPADDRPRFERVAVCGVGLLGGSLGLALKARAMAKHVVGVGRSESRLAQAVERGAIDSFSLDLSSGVAESDLVVLCSPVSIILEQIGVVMEAASAGAIVTDVGSTKESILRRVGEQTRTDVFFVGSHPMAGSEKSGIEHARADLYEGATAILTPDIRTSDEALDRVRALWRGLGMEVVELLPVRHDQMVAMLSHLPHLVASALVSLAGEGPRGNPELLTLVAGPGFRDTTRIAMGSAVLWRDIFAENRIALTEAIDQLIETLLRVRRDLLFENHQDVADFLDSAAKLRRGFNK